MIIVCILILIFILVCFFVSRKQQVIQEFETDPKEHPLYVFYPMISFVLVYVRLAPHFKKKELGVVYRKIAAILFGIILLSLLILLYELMYLGKPCVISEGKILRPQAGKGELTVQANYQIDQESSEMTLTVNEQILTGEDREDLFAKSFEWLDQNLGGDNESLEKITTDLNMVRIIPTTGMAVTYQIEGKEYVEEDGTVMFENVSEGGVTFSVRAILTYHQVSREKVYMISVYPKEVSKNERIASQLESMLAKSDEVTATEKYWELPQQIEDMKVKWSDADHNSLLALLVFGGIVIICTPFLIDQRIKEKQQEREEQMLIDYPEIVCKFTLLLRAGMTISAAWDRMTSDYLLQREDTEMPNDKKVLAKRKKKKQNSKSVRYAYEEMIKTRRELSLGASEETAYEAFGKRCHSLVYLRFSTVLVQNLKKGTRCIAQILEQEAREAFQERKEQAKRRGEKASTKLLGPTVGMFVIVICIILVPAFLSF